jgi:hypothetical protein
LFFSDFDAQREIKVKMIQQIQEEFYRQYREWKNIFIGCFILNVCAYGIYITNITYSIDDYGYIFTKLNIITSGRWLADFIYNVIFQASYMPVLSPLFCIACYIFTGIGLCKLWEVREKKTCFIIIALWCLHPYLLDGYNFRVAAVNLAVVYVMALSALLLVSRGRMGFVLSTLLFCGALSIYQAVISFTLSVIMIMILIACVRGGVSLATIRMSIKRAGSCLLMLCISVVLYFVLTKAVFLLLNLRANSRLDAGFISTLDQLWVKFGWLTLTLAVRILPIPEFVLPFVGKLVLFIILVLGAVAALKKSLTWMSAGLVGVWILLIPLAAVSFIIPLAESDLPWRVCMGLVVFWAGMFTVTQESCSIYIRRMGFASGVFLVGYFVLNNNAIFYKQYLCNQKDVVTGNRLIAKIQSLDNYHPGMELAIVGVLPTESFTKEGKGYREIVREYIKYSSQRKYFLAASAFETDWSKYVFLLGFLDMELKKSSTEKEGLARMLAAGHKSWPDPSSVFIQDEMVIVVLSSQ